MCEFRVQNISYHYRSHIRALENISLTIEKGRFLALLGPNGSGKTTLLSILSGVLTPASGQVILDGKDLRQYKRREIAQKIGFVPQNIHVDFPFTVNEIVLMGRFSHLGGLGIEKDTDRKTARWAMEQTEVENLADRPINQLSGGERQRVFIAQAIAARPSILMLDEPVSALDIRYKVQILELLKRLNRETGITVITILHDLNSASQYADRVLLLKKGTVAGSGNPAMVLTADRIMDVYGIGVEIISSADGADRFFKPVNIISKGYINT